MKMLKREAFSGTIPEVTSNQLVIVCREYPGGEEWLVTVDLAGESLFELMTRLDGGNRPVSLAAVVEDSGLDWDYTHICSYHTSMWDIYNKE